ncbi:terminase GpA, partial [Paramagnetospirillum caucaseum]
YEFLKRDDPLARGYVGFARGLGIEYFEQLTSERREEVATRGGRKVFRWTVRKGLANEALDTTNYAEAAATLKGWTRWNDSDWELLIAERDAPPDAVGTQLDLEHQLLAARPPTPSRPAAETPPASKADPLDRLA